MRYPVACATLIAALLLSGCEQPKKIAVITPCQDGIAHGVATDLAKQRLNLMLQRIKHSNAQLNTLIPGTFTLMLQDYAIQSYQEETHHAVCNAWANVTVAVHGKQTIAIEHANISFDVSYAESGTEVSMADRHMATVFQALATGLEPYGAHITIK